MMDVYGGLSLYTDIMKRLQIYIEEELDEALGVLAARERTSKAALIRRFVADRLGHEAEEDPFRALIGDLDGEPGSIDEIVYGS